MEKINKDLIKNIGISILVIIALILLIMVISYNKISIGKVIPKADEYQLDDEMKKELESEQEDTNAEIITTYELITIHQAVIIIVLHQQIFMKMMGLNNISL